MKGLTKREKILLSILGILLIVTVYAIFLFLPTLNKYISNKSLLEELQNSHVVLDSKVVRYGSNETVLNETKAKAEEQLQLLLPQKENDELQGYIVEIAKNNGLDIVGIQITGKEISPVAPEIVSEEVPAEGEKVTYTVKDSLNVVKGITEEVPSAPALYEVYLEENTVVVSFNSSKEQLQAFLDAIVNEGKAMKATGFDLDKDGVYYVTISVYSTQGLE